MPAVFILVLACTGCGGSDNTNVNRESDILKRPAFAAINDSIRQDPKNAGLYLRRAVMLSQVDAHEDANADYKKSWEINPTKESALQYAANLGILGKPAERLKFLQECIRKFPNIPEFKRLTGEAYIEAGKSKMALELYNNLLKKDSLDFEAWYEKGLLLEQLHDTAQAITALKKAYSLQPVNTYALELAHIYAETKNPLALEICDQVIHSDFARELVDPFFIKGIYYANTQQYNLAVIQFDSCIRRDWKFTDAYIEKGIAVFKQKNYDEALSIFQLAATVSNINPDAYYWIGRCYEISNKKEEARIYYEKAIILDKNFTEAKEALKRLSK
jgi:tetratricopeptide (TPR) repeat protein